MQSFFAAVADAAKSSDLGMIGQGALAYLAVSALKEVALRLVPPRRADAAMTDNQKAALYQISRDVEHLVEQHSSMADDGSPDWKMSNAWRREQREYKTALLAGLQEVTETCKRIVTKLCAINNQPKCSEHIIPEIRGTQNHGG